MGLGEIAAFVAHLRRHLEDLGLEMSKIRVLAQIGEPVAHAAKLAEDFEGILAVGSVSSPIGTRDVPHRHLDLAVRALELQHPCIGRQEEAQPNE